MADFDTEVAGEIARAHAEWSEKGSKDARDRLFELLHTWVQKQAHYMLVRRFGSERPVNTQTFTQDVLTKLLTHLRYIEYRGLQQLLGYLLAVLRTYLLDLARASQLRPVPLPAGSHYDLAAAATVELSLAPDSMTVTIVGGDCSSLVTMLDILGRIEKIHPLHGLVLQLRALAGFGVSETAEHLNLSRAEVDKMLRNARAKFRLEWNKAIQAEPAGST